MNYQSTLIAVSDLARSKAFYCDLLGMEVTADFGANVTLSNRISMQTLESWQGFIHKSQDEITFRNNAIELYFEEVDMDGFLAKLEATPQIEYVHPLVEHRWGQRVVRFYDPDRHIIEVGEQMTAVVRRFLKSGMTIAETAVHMDVQEDYIRSCIDEKETT